jgi:solute carrier family 25 iron transporter 28/37
MQEDLDDLEWEEWDGKSPFHHHCIAGSIAGVAEHTLLYPVDTVKTHMQAYCSTCPNNPVNMFTGGSPANGTAAAGCVGPTSQHAPSNAGQQGMWSTMRNLIQYGHANGHSTQPFAAHSNSALVTPKGFRQTATLSASSSSTGTIDRNITKGYGRLWRGVQTMATGCVPAHALYFSSYEFTKTYLSHTTINPVTGATQTHLGTIGASAAGAVSTFFHDVVMTPMDTVKQRMQLGHYKNMGHAFSHILHHEGWAGLYRSFGVTLLTNLPYGMVMVSTNEFLRNSMLEMKTNKHDLKGPQLDLPIIMFAGCGAGSIAAAATAPLDRVKTRLQTQTFAHTQPIYHDAVKPCPKAKASIQSQLRYNGLTDAFQSIVREEGYMGLWRGLAPRMMTHAPAVAISWTAYETAKRWLSSFS